LNRDWRGKDRATDVLSFPQSEWDRPLVASGRRQMAPKSAPEVVLGDIVISPDQAAKNARRIGQGLDRETCFLIVHGMLHLCGHDHMNSEEERLMLREQAVLMAALESAGVGKKPLWQSCVTKVERRV
jgi:probable rRNA maturation factor